VPLLATRSLGWRLAVTAAVGVFALSGVYQTLDQSFAVTSTTPGPLEAGELLRFAEREHVSIGYAGYWDAEAYTWATHFKLTLYPVYECDPATNGICGFPTVEISTWYTTHTPERSLLIVDPSQQAPTVSGVDAVFGRPIASETIGYFTAYVYAYNLNTRLVG
jgi:hypothetical protein